MAAMLLAAIRWHYLNNLRIMSARLRTTFTKSRTLENIHVRVWRRRLGLRLFMLVCFLGGVLRPFP